MGVFCIGEFVDAMPWLLSFLSFLEAPIFCLLRVINNCPFLLKNCTKGGLGGKSVMLKIIHRAGKKLIPQGISYKLPKCSDYFLKGKHTALRLICFDTQSTLTQKEVRRGLGNRSTVFSGCAEGPGLNSVPGRKLNQSKSQELLV